MGKKTSVYLKDEFIDKLRVQRRGPSEAITTIIARYTYLINTEKRKLNSIFSVDEFLAMKAICQGSLTPGEIRGGVLNIVNDAPNEEIEKYGANKIILESKLASLSIVQQFALVEAIEEMQA